jgi:hypothetical protein
MIATVIGLLNDGCKDHVAGIRREMCKGFCCEDYSESSCLGDFRN